MKPLHILCDLDSIAAALMPTWVDLYNKAYDDKLSIDDVKDFDIHLFTKPECHTKVYDLLTAETFLSLPVMPGAKDVLQELTNIGHTIHIVTAFSPDHPDTAAAKVSWTRANFPFINKRMITLMSQKHLIRGDVLIDDRPDTIAACRAMPNNKIYLTTIGYPYNESISYMYNLYTRDYKTPEKCWNEMFKGIVAYSEK